MPKAKQGSAPTLDKDILKVVRQAMRKLIETRKALYLNIINSFVLSEVQVSDEVFEVFKVLEDKVSIEC